MNDARPLSIRPPRSPSVAPRVQWRQLRRRLPILVAAVILIVGAMLMVAPFLWMFATSMGAPTDAYDLPPAWIPTSLGTDNYDRALNGPVPVVHSLVNSLIVAASATAAQLLTCSLGGYAFARLRFPMRNGLFLLLLVSLVIPIQVQAMPLFILMRNLDLIDNIVALILPNLTSALGIFMMRQFFLAFPLDYAEAAKLDGASEWRIFWEIALPLAKPALSTLGVIVFLLNWNSFFLPLVFITSIENATMPLALVLLLGPYRAGNPAVVMAATTIAVLPVLIVFLVAQRWLVENMSRVGVKG